MIPQNIKHFLLFIKKIGYVKLFGAYKDFVPIWLFNLLLGAVAFGFKAWFAFFFGVIVSIGGVVLWFLYRSREERSFVTILTFSNSAVSMAGIYFENQFQSIMYEWFLMFLVGTSFLVGIAFFHFAIKRDYYKEKCKKALPIGAGATITITFLAMNVGRLISRNVSQDIMDHVIVYLVIFCVFMSMVAVAMGWFIFYYSRKYKNIIN